MDDDNSTAQDVQATEAVEASPVTQDESNATDVQDESASSESQQDGAEPVTATEADEKLRKYAANQGIDLDSPGAIKAAQLAMKNQSEKTRNYQKATELEKATVAISDELAESTAQATGQDPNLIKRLQAVETKEMVRDFWSQPDIDKAYEPAMIELLKTKTYLAGDLESLYATAVMKSGGVAAVKSQGKREALESLAQKQQAAVPTGSATTSGTPKKKNFGDLSIAEMEKQLGFART